MALPTRSLSFRARLTLRWTLVFSCILAVASVWIYAGIRASVYADLDNHLRTLAGTEVTAAIDRPTASPHLHELPLTALAGSSFTEKLVQVLDADGGVVIASPERAMSVRLAGPREIAAALAGEAPIATVMVSGDPVRTTVLRATADGREYAIAVGVVISDVLRSLARVRWLLAVVWIVSTAATAAVGFALASTALDPVRRITARAVQIATSDIGARLEPARTQDEIGAMTDALNTLIGRLHVALDANRRFAADAAHELRSPLTAIAGEVEVALRRERGADDYRVTLTRVQAQLTALSTLMGDLMLLVRAQEGGGEVRTQELSLEALIAASVARADPLAASRGVVLRSEGIAGLRVYGDAGLLGRVFDNVIENAIRYNREHGSVMVRASFEDQPADVWVPGFVHILVSDTGTGIAREEHHRIFERFHRVDQSRARHTGGSGLGLAIAREVLALFKGTIRVASSTAQGTTLEILLPGLSAPAAAGTTDAALAMTTA